MVKHKIIQTQNIPVSRSRILPIQVMNPKKYFSKIYSNIFGPLVQTVASCSPKCPIFFFTREKVFMQKSPNYEYTKNVKFYVFQTIFTKTHSALKRQKPFFGAQGDHFFEKNISSRMLILDFLKTFLLISVHQSIYMPQN